MAEQRGLYAVEIRPVTAPDGRAGVLLQLPDAYILLNPEDAIEIADRLIEAAEEANA